MSSSADLTDDLVATFQLDGEQVRGRLVRLGTVIDDILSRHHYPEAVANLLAEACTLAALVGSSLKFEGRLIVQAQGDGPVSYVVGDYDTSGALRGYCQFDEAKVAQTAAGFARPGAQTLLGKGLFIMTIDPLNLKDRYQGVVPSKAKRSPYAPKAISLSPNRLQRGSVSPVSRLKTSKDRSGAPAE